MKKNYLSCDALIIGSGISGLSLALRLASYQKVIILSKGLIEEGSTFYAQGGIAAVFNENDSINSHIEDTLITGAGIVDKLTAEFIISNARRCVQWLIDQGVNFDTYFRSKNQPCYHLTREAGHSHRRILHVADSTGKVIETTLISKAKSHPNIQILEYSNAIDLILSDKINPPRSRRVVGVLIWDCNKEKIKICYAASVILATGGASMVYQHTTNPDTASGDGIAMAWRAGCRVSNLEFNQFHPTVLFHPQSHNFLLTEALRGEGAHLKRPDGSRFMFDFDVRGELAPRDVVTRAIDYEMKRFGAECMYLDISHKSTVFIRQHFPMIYEKLLNFDIDLTKNPVPIVPAAHYTCGGIVVDKYGRTDVDGLYAIGEVSYTGFHGANRMASNSLLECLVYSWSAAEDILQRIPCLYKMEQLPILYKNHPIWYKNRTDNPDGQVAIQRHRHKLRMFMWKNVGIVRTIEHLEYALKYIMTLKEEVDEYYACLRISNSLLELRNLVQVAELIIRCALMRKESRGLHYILDYPKQLDVSGPSVLSPLEDKK